MWYRLLITFRAEETPASPKAPVERSDGGRRKKSYKLFWLDRWRGLCAFEGPGCRCFRERTLASKGASLSPSLPPFFPSLALRQCGSSEAGKRHQGLSSAPSEGPRCSVAWQQSGGTCQSDISAWNLLLAPTPNPLSFSKRMVHGAQPWGPFINSDLWSWHQRSQKPALSLIGYNLPGTSGADPSANRYFCTAVFLHKKQEKNVKHYLKKKKTLIQKDIQKTRTAL